MGGRTEPASSHFRKFGNDHAGTNPVGAHVLWPFHTAVINQRFAVLWGRRFPLPAFSAALAVKSQPSAVPAEIGYLHPFTSFSADSWAQIPGAAYATAS